MAMADDQAAADDPKEHICTGCEENAVATSFCKDCTDWLCNQCVFAHRRVRVTKDHVIHEAKEAGMHNDDNKDKIHFCPSHCREPLNLFCETCHVLTCRDCQLHEHQKHKFKFVNEACNEHKVWLLAMVEKLQDKIIMMEKAQEFIDGKFSDISDREKKMGDEIKKFAIQFITDINRRGKKLLDDLERICRYKKTELAMKHSQIASLLARNKHAVTFTDEIIKSGSNTAMLQARETVSNQIKSLLNAQCQIPNPNYKFELQFTYDLSVLSNVVPNLGTIFFNGAAFNGSLLPASPSRSGQNGRASSTSPSSTQLGPPPDNRRALSSVLPSSGHLPSQPPRMLPRPTNCSNSTSRAAIGSKHQQQQQHTNVASSQVYQIMTTGGVHTILPQQSIVTTTATTGQQYILMPPAVGTCVPQQSGIAGSAHAPVVFASQAASASSVSTSSMARPIRIRPSSGMSSSRPMSSRLYLSELIMKVSSSHACVNLPSRSLYSCSVMEICRCPIHVAPLCHAVMQCHRDMQVCYLRRVIMSRRLVMQYDLITCCLVSRQVK